jgi:hypothetical protein
VGQDSEYEIIFELPRSGKKSIFPKYRKWSFWAIPSIANFFQEHFHMKAQ